MHVASAAQRPPQKPAPWEIGGYEKPYIPAGTVFTADFRDVLVFSVRGPRRRS
jgi:hypothetical protein